MIMLAPFPEPVGWLSYHQLYSGTGADIVMQSIALTDLCLANKRRKLVLLPVFIINRMAKERPLGTVIPNRP